ncbi:MAG: acid phosphatase [Xanthomonadales bacterium]|nr:acid phosphatase [Xanthomonadales bacterium]
MRTYKHLVLASLLGLLAACSGGTANVRQVAPAAPAPSAASAVAGGHENLNAVLWMQTAAEYEATTRSVFAAATALLDTALADPRWDALPPAERGGQHIAHLPAAVIVDADETMVDNSVYQARLVVAGTRYAPDTWAAWVEERRAGVVPGALEFARAAAQRGITVFYVTNRDAAGKAATLDNLRALGFPMSEPEDTVLTVDEAQGWDSAKGSRRQFVGERYRVLMMVGDNLGDFLDGYQASVADRAALMEPFRGWWGSRWFMLPNPTYGSWESALTRGADDPVQAKRRALRSR